MHLCDRDVDRLAMLVVELRCGTAGASSGGPGGHICVERCARGFNTAHA